MRGGGGQNYFQSAHNMGDAMFMSSACFIDRLMGLFRGAVFLHGRMPENCALVLMGLDDRQMTHLICVRLRHLLYAFLGAGGFGPSSCCFSFIKRPKTTP